MNEIMRDLFLPLQYKFLFLTKLYKIKFTVAIDFFTEILYLQVTFNSKI